MIIVLIVYGIINLCALAGMIIHGIWGVKEFSLNEFLTNRLKISVKAIKIILKTIVIIMLLPAIFIYGVILVICLTVVLPIGGIDIIDENEGEV
jgi:hypothetical protein